MCLVHHGLFFLSFLLTKRLIERKYLEVTFRSGFIVAQPAERDPSPSGGLHATDHGFCDGLHQDGCLSQKSQRPKDVLEDDEPTAYG